MICFVKCLNKGKIENFAPPYDLVMDKKTIFYELIHNLEKSESTRLIQMAKKATKSPEKLAQEKLIKKAIQDESTKHENVENLTKIEDPLDEDDLLDEKEKLLNKK